MPPAGRVSSTVFTAVSRVRCKPIAKAYHSALASAGKRNVHSSADHQPQGVGAKFKARHPNLVAPEVSSFKCGHDAPIYGVIEGIIEQ